MTPVTIVIPSHDGADLLKGSLPSVLATEYPQVEVVVVDNGSRDGSPEMVSARFPTVRVLQMGTNAGFARACNEGARQAKSPYVAFLNNDIRVDPGWLVPLVRALDEDPSCIAAGSLVLSWDGSTVDYAGGDINFEGRAFQRGLAATWPAGGSTTRRRARSPCAARSGRPSAGSTSPTGRPTTRTSTSGGEPGSSGTPCGSCPGP